MANSALPRAILDRTRFVMMSIGFLYSSNPVNSTFPIVPEGAPAPPREPQIRVRENGTNRRAIPWGTTPGAKDGQAARFHRRADGRAARNSCSHQPRRCGVRAWQED